MSEGNESKIINEVIISSSLTTNPTITTWKFESRDPKEYRTFTIESLKLEDGIRQFEAGEISSSRLAELVITGLLDFEFKSDDGKHWSWDGASASNFRKKGDIDVYDCEASYVWDWKDIYAVAKSKSIVGINPVEKIIILKNYSYYCAG